MRPASVLLACLLLALGAPAAFADTTPPVVTIASPEHEEVIADDPMPAFNGALGTAPGDFATVSVAIFAGDTATGVPLTDTVAYVNGGAWSAQAPNALGDGRYTLRVRQSDDAGNVGEALAGFWIDTTAPSPTLAAPVEGTTTTDSTPTFSGVPGMTDGDAETVTVEVFASGVGAPAYTSLVPAIDSWTATPATALADGAYTARVFQDDDAGHTGTAQVSFRIDATAPALTLTDAHWTRATGVLRLSGAAGTASGDSRRLTASLFSGPAATGEPIIASMSGGVVDGRWTVSSRTRLADGVYTARVQQGDVAGNVAVVDHTFSIEPAPPAAPQVPAPVASDVVAPTITLPRTITRKGRQIAARLIISEAGNLTVSLRLGRSLIAKESVAVRQAGRLTVKLALSRKALAKLRRSRAKLTLVVKATDGAGNARTARRTVKLKR